MTGHGVCRNGPAAMAVLGLFVCAGFAGSDLDDELFKLNPGDIDNSDFFVSRPSLPPLPPGPGVHECRRWARGHAPTVRA